MNRFHWILAIAGIAVPLSACADTPRAPRPVVQAGAAAAPVVATKPGPARTMSNAAPVVDASLPKVLVHKSPSCGCCSGWIDHMRRSGFAVQVHETDELEPIKKRLGVPAGKGSCHTAEVGGLVIEGHVPAGDIKRLIAAKDGSRGLVLPGMPAGSPGMEMPDGRVQRYTVERIDAKGQLSPFATHGNN